MYQRNLIGQQILDYTVKEELGSGAFSTVYKVVKTNASGRYVRALKHISIPNERQYNSVLNSMGGDFSKADNYFSEMLMNIVSEIRILNHLTEKGVQHIVRYYENDIQTVQSPRHYDIFILMEYLTPVEQYIEQSEFRVRDVMNLGIDVLKGLQACHAEGIIHRDIKDDNIFVSDEGEYKIGDFGVSKVLKEGSKADSLKGTPNFLAPEVYLGKASYTKSVDLYSLGIVLYRLLNYNRNPFLPHFPEQYYSQDEDSAFDQRMSGAIPEFPSLGGEEIGRVVVQSISGESERFETAEDFLSALEAAIAHTSEEILDRSVKLDTKNSAMNQTKFSPQNLNPTLQEIFPENGMYQTHHDQNPYINQGIFDDQIHDSPSEKIRGPIVNPAALTYQDTKKGKHRKKHLLILAGIAAVIALVIVGFGSLKTTEEAPSESEPPVAAEEQTEGQTNSQTQGYTASARPASGEKTSLLSKYQSALKHLVEDIKSILKNPSEVTFILNHSGDSTDPANDSDFDFDSEIASETDSELDGDSDSMKNKRFECYGHTYEIVIQDCTWTEALDIAREDNGYLLHINDDDEFQAIINELESDETFSHTQFFIGGQRSAEEETYYWVDQYGDPFGEPLNEESNFIYSYWGNGEPNYSYDGAEEDCLNLFYSKSEERWILNDVPNDYLTVNDFLEGKCGYIIEYGEEPEPLEEEELINSEEESELNEDITGIDAYSSEEEFNESYENSYENSSDESYEGNYEDSVEISGYMRSSTS